MCTKCDAPAAAGTKLCDRHRELQRAYLAKWRSENRDRHNAISNRARNARVRSGRCASCGVETAGQRLCPKHLAADRNRWFEAYGQDVLRRREVVLKHQEQRILAELESSPVLAPCWPEVKDWIVEHISLWIEPSAGVLNGYIEIGECSGL